MRGFSMLFQRNWGKIRRIGRPAACNRDAAGNLSRNVAEKMGPFGITCSDGTMTESENTNGSRRWCGGRCRARLYSAGGAEALQGADGMAPCRESLRGRLGARRPGRKRRGPAQPWRNVNPGRPVGTLDMGRQARSWREASAAADLHISMKCSDADAKGRRPGLFRRCFARKSAAKDGWRGWGQRAPGVLLLGTGSRALRVKHDHAVVLSPARKD